MPTRSRCSLVRSSSAVFLLLSELKGAAHEVSGFAVSLLLNRLLRARLLSALASAAAGFVGLTLAFCLVFHFATGKFFFFMTSIKFTGSFIKLKDVNPAPDGWLEKATWVVVPAAVLVGGIAALCTWFRRREQLDSAGRAGLLFGLAHVATVFSVRRLSSLVASAVHPHHVLHQLLDAHHVFGIGGHAAANTRATLAGGVVRVVGRPRAASRRTAFTRASCRCWPMCWVRSSFGRSAQRPADCCCWRLFSGTPADLRERPMFGRRGRVRFRQFPQGVRGPQLSQSRHSSGICPEPPGYALAFGQWSRIAFGFRSTTH